MIYLVAFFGYVIFDVINNKFYFRRELIFDNNA